MTVNTELNILNVTVDPSYENTHTAAVTFELDGETHLEWLNKCDAYWIVERIDSHLKYNYSGEHCIADIHDRLDSILEDLV